MDLEVILLSAVRETEQGKSHMIDCLHLKPKKSDISELIYKTEIDSQKNTLMVTQGERGGVN